MMSATNFFSRTALAVMMMILVVAATPEGDLAAEVEIKVRNFEFNPRDVVIPRGEVVKWAWESGFHTTTNGTGSSDPAAGMLWNSGISSSNETFSFQFNDAGFFPFYCIPHELMDMKGSITVEAPAGVGDDAGSGSGSLPRAVSISQNYPNPFNPSTTFEVDIPGGEDRHSTLKIYNVRGAVVKTVLDQTLTGGSYSFTWDGRTDMGVPVSSGIYIYRLEYGNEVISRKMTLLK